MRWRAWLLQPLDEFDAVTVGVAREEARHARNLALRLHAGTGGAHDAARAFEVDDADGEVTAVLRLRRDDRKVQLPAVGQAVPRPCPSRRPSPRQRLQAQVAVERQRAFEVGDLDIEVHQILHLYAG